jgi:rhodanese-related sulfurtransferase
MSIFSSIFGLNAQQLDGVEVLEPNAYKNAISNNSLQHIDVRKNREYNSGQITEAINIDISNRKNFQQYFEKLDREEPVYLYCRSGSRSQSAAKLLVQLGFKTVYDLQGGYLNWKK